MQLGVLTNIQRKPGRNDSTYLTARIKRQISGEVYLNQNSLSNKQEADTLVNGTLVFFHTEVRKRDDGDRLHAVDCSLAQPARLLEYLLALDVAASYQLGRQSPPAFRRALFHELEKLIADTTDPQVMSHLTAVKRELIPREDASPASPAPATLPILATQLEVTAPSYNESAFLHHVFTANSPDYANRLFPLLVEGIRAISDDDSFRQALFLLEFNGQLTEGKVPDLHTTFYMLAAPTYRFQFWLRGLVPYCDTDTLFAEFANGSEALKKRVLERCQGDAAVLLVPAAPPEAAPVLQAYFQGIKVALLEQLVAAKASIRVAVAWFTQDELFTVLCEKLQQNLVVELIINNDYINNWEFGLRFVEFIALGGKLYLSEHPAMMHHKFCIIDEALLFTGSYNWTYYADLYNAENALRVQNSPEVIASYLCEFERLKQLIGSPATSITPFSAKELGRFERIGLREYLSKDIHSRVSYTRSTRPTADPQRLAALLNQAIEIDESNEAAWQLLQDVAPDAVSDNYAIRAQDIVRQQVADTAMPPPPRPELASPAPAPPPPAPADESSSKPAAASTTTPTQPSVSKPAAPLPLPTVPAPAAAGLPRPALSPSTQLATPTLVLNTSEPIPSATAPSQLSINTSGSIPDTRLTSALYGNLQVVFALDYSNSMESYQGGGYKLYSSGKIQQVINMLFGIARGLTTAEKIDMFLFEDKVVPLPEVTKENYTSYVQDEVLKHPRGGTNIYAPIQSIHEKYVTNAVNKTNVFVILITDGENSKQDDNAKIKAYVATHHSAPIFWQFVGLGEKFAFLETVVAATTNAAFFSLNDVQSISDDTLLERLLQKFPIWLNRTK